MQKPEREDHAAHDPRLDGSHHGMTSHETDVDLAHLRTAYQEAGLDTGDVLPNPLAQFARWLGNAVTAGLVEPNAMTLATADALGHTSVRTVLLKSVDHSGFVFYTNYTSRKGAELSGNPACALLFAWLPLGRQVAVRGVAARIAAEDSDAYFATRPHGSQLGAWASPQSQVVSGRHELEANQRRMRQRFPAVVPRPPHWGGFRVVPDEIEFWQGQPDRLHDRLRYRRAGGSTSPWMIERLAP